ncbi:MAG: Gfo/Idh/MocA family oxidoreductase [SAR202 cluster bacterium]|nr:Gfo/Idh/MocA family oxidoreductase [SAR202 cluster bacterium]
MIPPKKHPVYRVGIIGGGRQGTHHARGFQLNPRTEVVAVADTDPENLKLFCERFKCRGYSTYDEMLAKETLDISAPVLPVKANPGAVIASARAGVKGIFCEKPLAATLKDADAMVEECRKRGIPLAAGLVISSHLDYRKAYRMAADGTIGRVLRINLYEQNHQVGTHGLNLVRKFAGKSEVDYVIGIVENDPHSDYEEAYEKDASWYGSIGGYIKFKNGVECFSSWTGPKWRGIEVIGEKGMIYNWNNTSLGLRLLKTPEAKDRGDHPEMVEVAGVFKPRTPEHEWDEEGWRLPGEPVVETFDALVEAIDKRTADLDITTGDDLRHALEIAVALRESARHGSVPVKLPIADRSQAMYPEKWRWHYKKDVYGAEWYREQMQTHIRK